MIVVRHADISTDGRYRYRLQRVWDATAPRMAFVMLNPSTADAYVDDPTIRRCMGFAQREGCGGLDVVNLYAYRATQPATLVEAAQAGVSVQGERNELSIGEAMDGAAIVVAAWGATFIHRAVPARPSISAMAKARGQALHCLGRTQAGYPRHPLYVRASQPLEPFGL